MNIKQTSLTALTLLALAACGGQAQTSVPADSAAQNNASAPIAAASAPAVPAGLVEGQHYTVLAQPIAQQQAGKVEVLEFFGYFCPHCAHLEPVLSEHVKTFKDDTYLRTEHVVWGPDIKPLARLAAAVEITGQKAAANASIFKALVDDKINLADEAVLKGWLAEQTAFDGKQILAAYESAESQARADQMEALTNAHQIASTPTVIVGGKYMVKFADWQSGMQIIDQLVDKVREEQKAAAK